MIGERETVEYLPEFVGVPLPSQEDYPTAPFFWRSDA